MNILQKLRRFFMLGVGEPDPDANPDPPGDETLDDLLDIEDAVPDKTTKPDDEEDPKAALERERQASKRKDEDLERERQARLQAEQRAAQAVPQRPQIDPDWEREDAEYKAAVDAGKDQQYLSLLRWQIDNNRVIRRTRSESQAALFAAQDESDRAAFERLEQSKPAIFKRYNARVDAAVKEMRARGQNAPRLAVLRLLIGDDLMNGTIKPKTKAPKGEAGTTGVDRGRTPGARSDVRGGKGSMNEREKRRERLRNQFI
jgi:hypothetical protein